MNATAFVIAAKDRSKSDPDGLSDDLFENIAARGEQFVGVLCEHFSLRSGRTARVSPAAESTSSGTKATRRRQAVHLSPKKAPSKNR